MGKKYLDICNSTFTRAQKMFRIRKVDGERCPICGGDLFMVRDGLQVLDTPSEIHCSSNEHTFKRKSFQSELISLEGENK